MQAVSKAAQAVLQTLWDRAKVNGGNVEIGQRGGGIMPVTVEIIAKEQISVCHYYEQNGDLMRDPEMDYWRGPDGSFYPAFFAQDNPQVFHTAMEFGSQGPVLASAECQRDLAAFTTTWMANIKEQQRL